MSLISLVGARLAYSDAPLLDNTELHIETNERVCLVGRNGAGKSTLLKVLNREVTLDEGKLSYEKEIVIARLEQDPPRNINKTVFDFVAEGLQEQAQRLTDYYALAHEVENNANEQNLKQLAQLQEKLDHEGGWLIDNRIRNLLMQLGLTAEMPLAALSGGWLRKAALAKALVCQPNVLLLDEPTNHLDIETIDWLENLLNELNAAIIFISHDRSFIQRMASRIVDLDRGKLMSWPGNYEDYLRSKQAFLRVEAMQNAEFDKRLAQEEVWIRQGIKARRTRNEGRVRALKAMRQEYRERRMVQGKAKMQVDEALRSGKIIFELTEVDYQIKDKSLVKQFSAQVLRGDKIALVGANGCGKTTLLKLMLKQLLPDHGEIYCGTNLEISYFDQHRFTLDSEKSVIDNLAEGKQEVMVGGRPRHIMRYLQDFLFHPKRAMTPVKALSGGEKNRLLLAKLFLKPSNLLILDEPTNDLDIETLELLEELISDYQGTVLLVSHDRQFVDNCVNECWIFEGGGQISRYIGGYTEAHQQQAQTKSLIKQTNVNKIKPMDEHSIPINKATAKTKNKLSYHEAKELEQLPERIEQLEQHITKLQQQISDPTFFEQSYEISQSTLTLLAEKETELQNAFDRWEKLEAQKR